jgi:putative DNA primase/helicase
MSLSISDQTRGEWPRILTSLAGLTAEQVTDKHQPCPFCGGKDRYRFDDIDGNGTWYCNKCGGPTFSGGAGNGWEVLKRKRGWNFAKAAEEVRRYLGIIEKRPQVPVKNAETISYYGDDLAVARLPDAKTGKTFRQFWFDGNRWQSKLPPKYKQANSKPLLNLGKIRATADWVLVVEGEKTCDAAAKLFPHYACTTWSGGCKGHGKTDFSPLKGRKILLWPDADEEGINAMQAVADKLLRQGAIQVRIVTPPKDSPKGWDLADATWSTQEAADYISNNCTDLTPSVKVEEEQESKSGLSKIEPGSKFTPLGHLDGYFFYQTHNTGQVTRLSRSGHTNTNLVSLATLEWWQGWCPDEKSKDKVAWLQAASNLFEMCHAAGQYKPERVRGRGAWWDKDEEVSVLHLGDRILTAGKTYKLKENLFRSDRYIYESLAELEAYGDVEALDDESALWVFHVASQFLWENPTSALLLAGWVTLAPICGALDWRPHIWLTAAAGSGKSAILDRYITPLLSDVHLAVVNNTTEAGIRQDLRSDALPVVFDEAESNEKSDQLRIQNILSLARVASSESHAKTIKGSSTGEAKRFHVRSMFMMSSISTSLKQGADRSRFAQLSLKNPGTMTKAEDRAAHWKQLDQDLNKYITPKVGKGLIHRTINLIPSIRESAQIFAEVFAEEHGSQRQGDQYGTLLAGYWSLLSQTAVTRKQALDIIRSNNFDCYAEQTEISDEQKCIQHILQHQLKVEGEGKTVTRSIAELIEVAAQSKRDPDLDVRHAKSTLGRHGIKVDLKQRLLIISNTAKGLAGVLQDTPWSTSWPTMLKRLDGAFAYVNDKGKAASTYFSAGLSTKAVAMSLKSALPSEPVTT